MCVRVHIRVHAHVCIRLQQVNYRLNLMTKWPLGVLLRYTTALLQAPRLVVLTHDYNRNQEDMRSLPVRGYTHSNSGDPSLEEDGAGVTEYHLQSRWRERGERKRWRERGEKKRWRERGEGGREERRRDGGREER